MKMETTPSSSTFDIKSYISRYDLESNISLQRLLFLSRKTNDKEAARIGFELLEKKLKSKGNVTLYRDAFDPILNNSSSSSNNGVDNDDGVTMELDGVMPEESGGAALVVENDNAVLESAADHHHDTHNIPSTMTTINFDKQYIQTMEENAANQIETLKANVSNSEAHLSKDSIRNSYLALAKFYHSRGMSEDAIRYYQRAKEYCSNSSGGSGGVGSMNRSNINSSAMGMGMGMGGTSSSTSNSTISNSSNPASNIILSLAECGLETHDPKHDKMVVNLYELKDSNPNDSIYNSKLQCARGIAYLNQGRYYLAALTFLSIKQIKFTTQFRSVLSAEDVALYGGLLGLITLNRSQIESMLEIEAWRERLELYPSLQEGIRCYMKAEYGKSLHLIQSIRDVMELDIFLYPHVDTLWTMMREKCIVQYFQPYSSVSLITMKESFGFENVDEVEDIVSSLIESKRIVGAKIDGVNRTLTNMTAKGLEQRRRKMMMRRVGMMGDKLIDEVEGMILRMSCIENDIVVTDENKSNRRNRGGGRGSGGSGGMSYDRVIYSSDEDCDIGI